MFQPYLAYLGMPSESGARNLVMGVYAAQTPDCGNMRRRQRTMKRCMDQPAAVCIWVQSI